MDFIKKMFGEYLKYYVVQFVFLCGLHLPSLIRLCGESGDYMIDTLIYLLVIFISSVPAYLFFCVLAYITDKLL